MNRRIVAVPFVLAVFAGCASPAATSGPVATSAPAATSAPVATAGAGATSGVGATSGPGGTSAAGATSAPGATAGSAAGHIAASEKDFAITVPATASAGSTTFDVTNTGTVAHEFIVVKTDLAADKLPTTNGDVAEDQLTISGQIEEVAPGGTQSLVVDLAAGHYVDLLQRVRPLRGRHAPGSDRPLRTGADGGPARD